MRQGRVQILPWRAFATSSLPRCAVMQDEQRRNQQRGRERERPVNLHVREPTSPTVKARMPSPAM